MSLSVFGVCMGCVWLPLFWVFAVLIAFPFARWFIWVSGWACWFCAGLCRFLSPNEMYVFVGRLSFISVLILSFILVLILCCAIKVYVVENRRFRHEF